MTELPAFLDRNRPDVPDIAVPRAVTPFFLPNTGVRGRLIRLGPLAEALLGRHDHPPPIRALLGQALAMVAGLATALKFTGSFSLQIKGDGAVPLLLADCTESGALRGYARVDREKLARRDPDAFSAASLFGAGYFALTVDQGAEMERHQGIVAIEGAELADMVGHYFETSEQTKCQVHLAAAPTPHGWRASALVLERIAAEGGVPGFSPAEGGVPGFSPAEGGFSDLPAEARQEAWNTARILAQTITEEELLDDTLPPERLLYRLFHGEGVAADRPRPLAYGCRCSRQRLAAILEGFSTDDLDHMAVEGDIVMTCEFCNFDFRFDRGSVNGTNTESSE